jgi:hypothetical protein
MRAMTSLDRLDPLTFNGCFAYLESDIPPGVTLPAWRSQRTASNADGSPVAGASIVGDRGGADLAPQDRTLRSRETGVGRAAGAAPSPRS